MKIMSARLLSGISDSVVASWRRAATSERAHSSGTRRAQMLQDGGDVDVWVHLVVIKWLCLSLGHEYKLGQKT